MSSYYFDLINQRTSRRSYRSGALSVDVPDEVRRLLGTYGFIQGARYVIAGQGSFRSRLYHHSYNS